MICLISLIDVLKIHKRVTEYDREENPDDYTSAVRSLATLELMFEYMLKETNTVFQNAAIVVYTIAGRHPFFNGNKRTGFEAMNYVLEDAGYKITAPAGEVINFIVSVAATEKEISLSEIEQWISENTSKS